MSLNQLARRYLAFENIDKGAFQRQARVLQSMWREQHGYPIGEQRGRRMSRPLGSRLAMPWAQETLANYLSETVREVVRREVLDEDRSRGKLFARPRIFDDLLSSQPMAFNLFGELQQDLALATSVFKRLTNKRIFEVTAIEFEYSPGRGDTRYTGDRSAFDVFMTYLTPGGEPGFGGIEVKYHENLIGKAARHRARYDEVAAQMGCFRSERMHLLREQPLQQIWRDHLLAGSLVGAEDFADGFFGFLYPQRNEFCSRAVGEYLETLSDQDTFMAWTLEDVCTSIASDIQQGWIVAFQDRYLDFEKIARALADGV